MIKLYKASNFKYTPFENFVEGDLEFLNENGITIVNQAKNADIIISQNTKYLKPHFWRGLFGKKFLIWTLESRFNTLFKKEGRAFFNLVKYHVMNVYTRDVFVSNFTFHSGLINENLKLIPDTFEFKSKKIVALMSYYKGLDSEPLLYENANVDLIALRSEIALDGAKAGCFDVFGKGWPKGVSKEDSRSGDWVTRKKQLLDDYHFNLCFENTAAYNYMTEKIWDSIENYCLPIYYSKFTSAYEVFPKDSFIDYADFESTKDLFEYIDGMETKEFVARMNKCITVYNTISAKGNIFVKAERKKMLEHIVTKVNNI